jgi:hypothetical protein
VLKIEQKKGTSLVKLVLSLRKSASRLKTVQRLSVPVIYFPKGTGFHSELANYKRPETSMNSIERLLQSRSIMDTIEATETILTKNDMKEPFTIVFPEDSTLKRVALKLKIDGSVIRTANVLRDFRRLTTKEVALSCSWWNLHGNYKDKDDKKQSYGRDMNWSYLHFKNHVDIVLYNNTDKEFHTYDKKERGGPLFFKLLTDSVLTANEDSLAALESTIKVYNIASDRKDDVPESIKVLKAGSKTIQATRKNGSCKRPLPNRFVVDIITVFKTTSVDMFNNKMDAYLGSLELAELVDDSQKINTPAGKYHKQLFDAGTWEAQVQAKAKSSFATMWRNRCWNCEKEDCTMSKCKQPIDSDKCERNRLQWLSVVRGNSTPRSSRNNDKRGGKNTEFPECRPPEASENNKRVIYGRPCTWDGRKSWVMGKTPPSGLSDIPPRTLKTSGDNASVPTQVTPPASEDATALQPKKE